MISYLEGFLKTFRPVFSRNATFFWFVIVFVGFVMRFDSYGVSSIVRGILLSPEHYPCLLNFFHSSAWSKWTLLEIWWKWLLNENLACHYGERLVFLGDHTKTVKDGRRIPEVTTLHQDSETGSKPSYFRGHQWACLCLLSSIGNKIFGMPLWTEIHQDNFEESRCVRIINVAAKIFSTMGKPALLVLDAFFAVGPVFLTAANHGGLLHILVRAKNNVVAFLPPKQKAKKGRGRPSMYGKKLKLVNLFDSWESRFNTTNELIYHKMETVRYLSLDLLWKPVKTKMRFFLIESSRGRIILMTQDFTMTPLQAIQLYCQRVYIENVFNLLKNLLGGLKYHFWSKHLSKASRSPKKNSKENQITSNPEKTMITLNAIENFVTIQVIVLGFLQLLSCKFGTQINTVAKCWLRTSSNEFPSEFITKIALTNELRMNLFGFGKNWIIDLIRQKQMPLGIQRVLDYVA